MEALRALSWQIFGHAAAYFTPGAPYGAPSLIGALLCMVGWYVWRRRGRTTSLRHFARAMFPARILNHPSSWVDMRLWALNVLALAAGYSWLAVGAWFWRERMLASLSLAGPAGWLHAPPLVAILVTTLVELLAFEFAYWFSHFVFHRVPWLWEFHKVHHSAEVMTVLTEMRQHPIEIIAFMNASALATGLVFGAMTWVFGPGAHSLTLLNGNLALALFLMTWGHLRHSHVWIPFRGLAGRLFQSPAHHQVHHSLDAAHYDKNLGFALAVWDWAFGTLHVPARENEIARFGVGEEYEDYATVGRSLTRPFGKSAEVLGLRAPHAPAGVAHDA